MLAWFYHVESDQNMAKHLKSNGPNSDQYPNKEVAKINDHHHIYYSCRKLPFPLVARDWLQRGIFKSLESDSGYMLVYRSVEENDVPPFTPSTLKENEKRIRGNFMAICLFERLPFDCTKFTYIVKADIRGNVPKVVAETGLSGQVETVRRAYNYFERDEEVDR